LGIVAVASASSASGFEEALPVSYDSYGDPRQMAGGAAAMTVEVAEQVRLVLAQNVRQAREQAGMTQEDLAGASGVARETIARLERGDREPRLMTLVAFSLALSLPLETLLTGIPGL
jgi:DNA-binding XRE family transcriptional regulator